MVVEVNKKNYHVNTNEFLKLEHKEYFNLNILEGLGSFERIVSILKELPVIINTTYNNNISTSLLFYGPTHGGFVPINAASSYQNVYLSCIGTDHIQNIYQNIQDFNVKNVVFGADELEILSEILVVYSHVYDIIETSFISSYISSPTNIVITEMNKTLTKRYKYIYKISNTNLVVYVPETLNDTFVDHFKHYLKCDKDNHILDYDNLINMCIMVKNGGELFEEMLKKNIDVFDRWTILDTGSTDGTVNAVKRILVGKKNGALYEEPFINFRDSRNRCLDLAGTQCKYNLMLDDTYVIEGDLRAFLNVIRGDQFGDSYSLTVKSYDVEYISNRITKTENRLKYIYTMHEVIQHENNTNVRVPENCAIINDMSNKYMQDRSDNRKEYDLKCLYEMVEEYPDDPRHLFYLGQTYKMLSNYEKAAKYYEKRAFFHVDGFDQEKFDALFEFTRISVFQLNKPWRDFERYYEMCIEWQPTRPEGNYFLGIHYFMENDTKTAFKHFKRAFEIGFPYHQQYSLKPTLSFNFVPYYLSSLCYEFKEYKLGLESTTLFLNHNKPTDDFYNLITDWHKIYSLLANMPAVQCRPKRFDKPIFCIVADGGFTEWSGRNILTTGVGGSETWVIETARYIQQLSNYEVVVFCKCSEEEVFEGVKYLKLSRYLETVAEIDIEHCIISRFSEYIPAAIEGHVKNIHVILHDLQLSGNVIPIHPKIKNIFCLTEWHCDFFLKTFPQFSRITHPLHYGIDFANFLNQDRKIKKVPYSFIYSSFPNRGLRVVLQMWPKIVDRYPQAVLHIFTDVNNKWANDFYPEELEEVRNLLDIYKETHPYSVINHGWMDKKTLANYWKQSEVWLYPCTFMETFCLTALECALTRTLAITNDLAALQDTVGDRGIVIPGTATTREWQDTAFLKICEVFDNPCSQDITTLIDKNYEWAMKHSWKDRTAELLNTFINTYTNDTNDINDTIGMTLTLNENMDMDMDKDKINNINKIDKINKIYYINLSKREDRNTHFMEQMKKHSIPSHKIVRFEAVNGESYHFTPDELQLFKGANYLYMVSKLQIMGNQMSHFKIFLEMIEKNYETIIIFQDDVILKNNFATYIDRLTDNLPEDSEIVHFGFHKYAARDIFLPWDLDTELSEPISHTIVNNDVCRLYPHFNPLYNTNNTTGYILTLQGAKNYVDWIYNNGFKYATDCDMNKYLINKNIFYGSRTVLATTNPTLGSDVFENIYNSQDKPDNPYNLTVNNNFLNYLGMYNWTNDLPLNENSKINFVKILCHFIHYKECRILEIGTFVGTSVIGMFQYLPNARATTVDTWKSYTEKECGTNFNSNCLENIEQNNVECVFYENLAKAQCLDRVTPIKGDSAFVLIDLIKQGKQYDFVYVDGSHKCIDCYTDCLLSWHMLDLNGIMGIDDYIYQISLTDDLENVKRDVDHFLEKIKGQYILMKESGYRIFIKKISLDINNPIPDF